MKTFQSVVGLVKVGPVESNFVKTLTNMYMNFSFVYVNIRQLKFVLAANKSI